MAPPTKRAGIRDDFRRNGTTPLRHAGQDERREFRLLARHSAFVSGRHGDRALGAHPSGMGNEAQAIVDRVKALGSDELHDRYHELVDKRLLGTLDFTELFELERIDARLDTEDPDEAARLTVLQEDWRRERNELVASIEHLLAHLKTAS